MNVAPGVLATDAANVGQLNALSGRDDLAADTAFQIGKLRRESNSGIAMAIALSAPGTPARVGRTALKPPWATSAARRRSA
jgi:hypothetical protein